VTSADTALGVDADEAAVVAAVQAGDESAFAGLVGRHRRELHVHCYRMVGSFDEAEDLVQEVFLRAWRGRAGFAGRSTFRAWLYRIATNLCLDASRRRARRPVPATQPPGVPPVSDLPWLQPYPDRLLAEIAPPETEPDAVAVAKETIELAFLAAIQLLPPRQRAVLILRDVLGWSAAESATLLDGSVAAVNSALQRARATLQKHWPGGRLDWAPAADPSEQERLLLQRYMDAHERVDADAVVALLRADARLAISPGVGCWDGRAAIAATLHADMGSLGQWRMLPTRANRQPAAAGYLRRWGDREYRAFVLVVLRIEDGSVVELAAFERADLFAVFGLPPVLR
jgi:RNA polymerase sigma-70 factor (ECF subfamily)